MATENNATPVLADSVAHVVAEMNNSKAKGDGRLVEVNKFLFDETLFSKSQRASALKQINTKLGTNFTMSLVKKAVKQVARPIHVDGLSGTAVVDNQPKPSNEGNAEGEEMKDGKVANLHNIRVDAAGERIVEIFKANNLDLINQPGAIKTVAGSLLSVQSWITLEDEAATEKFKAGIAKATLTGTEETLDELAEWALATDAFIAFEQLAANLGNNGVVDHLHTGTTTTTTTQENVDMKTHTTAAAQPAPVLASVTTGPLPTLDPAILGDAVTEASASVTVATNEKGAFNNVLEKVNTALRGKRETGFSSGTVAAAAAVLGGGAEILVRGNLSFGSGVGTVVGAVGAYFAAEALDGVMKSETGRYVVAGSVGLVAGGLGSRLGRMGDLALFGTVEQIGEDGVTLTVPAAPAVSVSIPGLDGMV